MGAEVYPDMGVTRLRSLILPSCLSGEVTGGFQVRVWDISKHSQVEKTGKDTVGQRNSPCKGTRPVNDSLWVQIRQDDETKFKARHQRLPLAPGIWDRAEKTTAKKPETRTLSCNEGM